MKAFTENLLKWADHNNKQVNTATTKDVLLTVSSFKLLGVYVRIYTLLVIHTDNMVKKATQRLYF